MVHRELSCCVATSHENSGFLTGKKRLLRLDTGPLGGLRVSERGDVL